MNILGFLSAAILLTLMPGPDILFVITQSITRGKKAGIIFACGLCTGLIAHTAAVSLGLSLILYNSSGGIQRTEIYGGGLLDLFGREIIYPPEGKFVGFADCYRGRI